MLNLSGNILYQECRDRFGEITSKWIAAQRGQGRREKETDQLVQSNKHLRNNWRRATEVKKALWENVKWRQASLQRAECICKCRKRKEKEKVNFLKNTFKHYRQLLEDKKCGKLEVTKEEQHIRGQ